MSTRPSIHELLVKRSRRFSYSVILVIVFLFVFLQSIVLIYEHLTTKQLIATWLGKNQSRIEQALFLENSLGIQGVLGELGGLQDLSASVRVLKLSGEVISRSADHRVEQCGFTREGSAQGYRIQLGRWMLCYRGSLVFNDRQYGWIEMSAYYSLASLLTNTMICWVISLLVFLVVRRSATLLLRELNRSVMSPISYVASQMAAQRKEIKDLVAIESNSARFREAPVEVLNLVESYNSMVATVSELSAKETQRIELLSYSQVADQVSHDIRSPLAALNMVLKSLKDVPEDLRLILRSAAQRIADITHGLQKNKERPMAAGPLMLIAALDSIVSEKRTQYRDKLELEIQVDLERGYGLFVNIDAPELARVVSNLVNNSVEAFDNRTAARVLVSLSRDAEDAILCVSDNGPGMPSEVLAQLGKRGVSLGKEGFGRGLGVHHAIQTIEAAGGSVHYEVHEGTRVTIRIPCVQAPRWFVDELVLDAAQTVVSIDDDQTIHQIWAGRLASAGMSVHGIGHQAFTSADTFEKWLSREQNPRAIFFVDYEFIGQRGSQNFNGLDIIERNGIARRSILVTSRYEEIPLRDRAESLGVKLLPKSLAPIVPLRLKTASKAEPQS